MKNFILLFLLVASFVGYAQTDGESESTSAELPSDPFFFDVGAVLWDHEVAGLTTEDQSYHIGLNVYKEFAASKFFALASGLGISWNNVYTNMAVNTDRGADALTYSFLADSINYKRNKLVATYIDIPLELRFRTKANKSGNYFRFHVGGKAGLRVSGYSKYVADNIKSKTYKVTSFAPVRYGLQGRIGFGGTSVYVFYPLNKLFDTEDIPFEGINDIQAVTVGLTFSM